MSDETQFNPLGNFDPFACENEQTVDQTTRSGDAEATVGGETTMTGNAAAARGSRSGKIGWKAYTITGIGAIALTGGALAGVGAFDTAAAPKVAKATPKAADNETDEANGQAAVTGEDADEAVDEPVGQAAAAAENADGPDYAAASAKEGYDHADDPSVDEGSVYAGEASVDEGTDYAAASHSTPDFDHTQYSPLVIEFSDNCSFADAFASARECCGVGGTFVWHDRVYSTYYREEWDAMTTAEKNRYMAVADRNYAAHRDEMGHFSPDHYAENTIDSYDDDYDFGPDTYDDTMAQVGPVIDDDDDFDMTLGDIRAVDFEDGEMIVGDASIDGHQAVFIDADNDGVFDLVGIDANDNGELDEGELIDIQGQNLTVGDFQAASEDLNPMAYNAGLDDFTNDADVTDFA